MSHFAGLLERTVLVEQCAIGACDPLLPEEQTYIAGAVQKRQREYAAGRHCARRALARLGLGAIAVPTGPDRAPVWPHGIAGSITHTDDMAAAAVCRIADGFRAIGIDLEPALALPDELIALVATPSELAWLARQPRDKQGILARVIYSAKEATFKAQFPLTRRMLEFADVETTMDEGCTRFAAVLNLPGHVTLDGRVRAADRFIATAATIR